MAQLQSVFMRYALLALGLATAAPAKAVNIYEAGSEGDALYKKVQYLLPPEVVPVFIPAKDRGRILKKMDYEAYPKTGLNVKTVSYLIDKVSDKMSPENGVRAYAITGGGIPGNTPSQKFCGIIFTTDAAQNDEGVLMHEAIHCKNAYVIGSKAYVKAANPAWQLSKKLTARQFKVMLDEATAGGLQVAYAYNSGKTAGLPMVQRYAALKENGVVSIGHRTAKGLLELCGRKDACPTDTVGMINIIVQNKPLLNDLMTDMFEIQAASEKAGLVVADQ
ncbi:hypothetical protein [Pseudomonas sp. PLMAX]|uniref:hypothetical protein n=1 Tax=Pseudomonas sp. PLMAX TaxID=2201998 RepID=UPI0038BDD016